MDLKTIFESASELKNILHHRSDLVALEENLANLLRQLNAALLIEDTGSAEFIHLAGVVYKFFEGSQSATNEVMKLWEISLRINSDSPMALVLVRTFSLLLKVLSRRSTFVPYASKIAKDSFSQQTKFINRCLSASSAALPVCALDLLTSMALVDSSCAEFLYESIDFTMKAYNGFVNNRRNIVMDYATGVEGDQRSAFISFFSALLTSGKYEVKLACLKMTNFMSPIVSGLFNDAPVRVLTFLNMIDTTILENEQQSKNMAVAFLTPGNTNNFMKLLEYDNPIIKNRVLEILSKLSSRQSPSNIIFKVEKLSADESSCLRNKVLQNVLKNLKIFDSFEQLQLALRILEECPDIVNSYVSTSKFMFEPESSIKWLTLFSFLSKIVDFRPAAEVEIEKVPSMEYMLESLCPTRAALTRALLNDSALVKLYSLQFLVSMLRRTFWCVELIETELSNCLIASVGIAEMSRRVELLEESRSATISAAEKLIPDIKTLQGLLNLLLSEKSIQCEGDLESELLPQDWRDQLISLCLESLQQYTRIFVSQEDTLGQSQYEDPVKFLSVLFNEKALPESLEIPVLKFASVFPRISVGSSENWSNFFTFIGAAMNQNSSAEKQKLARTIFKRILYSTGLFISCPNDVEIIASCMNSLNLFPRLLKDILQLQGGNNGTTLIFERERVCDGTIEISPLLSKWLKLEISDEIYELGQKVLDLIIQSANESKNERVDSEEPSNKRVKTEDESESERERESDSSDSDSSDSDSDDSDSDSDDLSDSVGSKRKLKVLEKRVDFELPDPETTDPAILLSQLLNNLDRDRMHNFIQNFPVERRLVPPAQRRRVNENMLKDLLYGSEDFLLFCNWLGLLAHFVACVPKDKLDGYTLVRSNLLGAIVMGLSSEDNSMRRVCGHLLATIHDAFRPTTLQEMNAAASNDKIKQVYSLLCQLRRSIKYDDTNGQPRASLGFFKLSGVTAFYYSEALSIMIHPDHHMFSPIGFTVHSGAFQSLSGVPLFDILIRRQVEDEEERENIIERPVFIRQLHWFLKIIQFGCKNRSDLERYGPLNKSRVLETIFSLLTIFSASIGKNLESERVVISILKTLKYLKSIEGVEEFLQNELGQEKWFEMLLDVILKAKTPLNKARLIQIQNLLE